MEAESTAFIVCAHYGLDTSDYTFPYLAGWSSSQELEQLHASLDRIQHQADELIQRVDAKLLELQKEVPERSAVIEQTVEQDSAARAQLIGTSGNTAYYVFPDGLTMDALADIKTPADSYVMIAPTAHLSEEWMQQHHIRFLKTGRDVETQELQTPEKLIARLQQNKDLRSSAFDHLPDGRGAGQDAQQVVGHLVPSNHADTVRSIEHINSVNFLDHLHKMTSFLIATYCGCLIWVLAGTASQPNVLHTRLVVAADHPCQHYDAYLWSVTPRL